MPRRPTLPDDVYFPVVPMLDMAFQLLAFFILTFQPPGRESRIDLDMPTAPVALPLPIPASTPSASKGASNQQEGETPDVVIRAEADPEGGLASLRLQGTTFSGSNDLQGELRRLVLARPDRTLTVGLVADEQLRYGQAARLLGACSNAGVTSVRLVPTKPVEQSSHTGEEQ